MRVSVLSKTYQILNYTEVFSSEQVLASVANICAYLET